MAAAMVSEKADHCRKLVVYFLTLVVGAHDVSILGGYIW
jgi:hypothetical protein